MKLIFTALRARARRASCASSASTASSTSPTARRRCCPGRRRSRSRSGSSSPARPPGRCRAPASARAIGDGNLICADVGGTSTDVSLVVDGQPFVNNTFELEHDLVINALSTEISSVGAGGGSIVSISPSGDVLVGPDSAGSDPGPGLLRPRRHAPTMTDACLLMGILDPDGFAGGEMRLDADAARGARSRRSTRTLVARRARSPSPTASPSTNIAEEVANVAIRHGVDPRDFTLVAYGAAGPMLLPAALELLHVRARRRARRTPACSRRSGLLSTDLVYYDSRSAYVMLAPDSAAQIDAVLRARWSARCASASAPTPAASPSRRSFDGRLFGQSWETPFVEVADGPIDAETIPALVERFHDAYERRYGNRFDYVPVQGVSYRVELVVPSEQDRVHARATAPASAAPPRRGARSRSATSRPSRCSAAEYERERCRSAPPSPGRR